MHRPAISHRPRKRILNANIQSNVSFQPSGSLQLSRLVRIGQGIQGIQSQWVCVTCQSMQTSLKPNIFPVMTKNLMETVSCCSCSQQLRPETWTVAEESFAKTPLTAQKQQRPEEAVGGDYTSSTCSTTVIKAQQSFSTPVSWSLSALC